MWSLKRTYISMTLVDPYVVCEKNSHEMTPVVVNERIHISMTMVVPYVVCEKYTHAMTLAVVNEKNTHFNDTSGSICGM